MVDVEDRQIVSRELQTDDECFHVGRVVEDGLRDIGPDECSDATTSASRSVDSFDVVVLHCEPQLVVQKRLLDTADVWNGCRCADVTLQERVMFNDASIPLEDGSTQIVNCKL